MKKLSLLLSLTALPTFSTKSTTFSFERWANGYIFAMVTNPTDDMNSINSTYDCSRLPCSYGTRLYVIRKDGSRVSGGATNTKWVPWGAVGKDSIVRYLQTRHNPFSVTLYFPSSVKPEDIRMICTAAWISNEYGTDLTIADTCESGGGTVPPLPDQPFCETSDRIELEHGVVHAGDVTGHRITKNISFTCNQNVSSSLSIMNSDVKMSGPSSSLTSKVLIDGKNQLKLNMQQGINTYALSSEFNATTEIKPGNYTGSTVLTWQPD
ncbi:hypothetical protein ACX43S_25525 [Enterobacter cloacae]